MSTVWHDLGASMVATAVAEVATTPICTLKTVFQNQSNGLNKTIQQTMRNIYRVGGIKQFYNASPAAVSSQVLSTGFKYTLYRYLERNYQINPFVCGFLSGVAATIFTHPIDAVRVYLQMGNNVGKEFKQRPFNFMYRGYSRSFLKSGIGSSCFYPIYDFCKRKVDNPVVASGLSAIISTTIMQPFDYSKNRAIYGLTEVNKWNPFTYYRGYSLNLFRIVPHFIITMTVIEHLGLYI